MHPESIAATRRRSGQGSQTALGSPNLSLIRKILKEHGGLTQVEIAPQTGFRLRSVGE